jgi:uncharacterized protein (TIGR04255 family)
MSTARGIQMAGDTDGIYRNPPITEMFCGLVFEPIATLKIPHYGLFWNEFRTDYPYCQHAAPIGFSPPNDESFGLPLPRIWFLSKSENTLIQLQTDRIIFNWRRLKPEDKYPKYCSVVSEFRSKLELFTKFIEYHQLGRLKPVTCELSYINHIPKGQGWEKLTDLSNVLADFCWNSTKERMLSEPRDLKLQSTFAIPDSRGSLTLAVGRQIGTVDKIPMIVLQLTANGLGPDHSSDAIWKWFDNSHELINVAFEELTTSSIRELWK